MFVADMKEQRERRPDGSRLRDEDRFVSAQRRGRDPKSVKKQGDAGEEASRDDRLQAHAGIGGGGARWWIRTTDPRRVKAVLYR